MTDIFEDVLSPRQTGEFVADSRNPNVKCNDAGVMKAAKMIVEAMKNGEIKEVDFDAHELHPKTGCQDSVDW